MKKACSKGSLIWLTLDKIKSKYSEINCGISNGVNTEFVIPTPNSLNLPEAEGFGNKLLESRAWRFKFV